METKSTSVILKRVFNIFSIMFFIICSNSLRAQTTTCDAHFVHYSINNPDSIHFYPTGTTVTNYEWDFGDGTTSTDHIPWHVFAPGNYLACLLVIDSTSSGVCTTHFCDSVHIANNNCNAHFSHYSLSNPDSVHFYPLSTAANHYHWNFGDGDTSDIATPWHNYAPGNYVVCLTVSDSNSAGICTATICDSIHVGNNTCNAHFSHYILTNPDSLHFYPLGTSANEYHWEFGDGSISNSVTPWHLYPASGIYYVCLTVRDSDSTGVCSRTFCDSVKVGNISCNANFTHNTFVNPDSVHFYPAATNFTSYIWNFGDGMTSTAIAPIHRYMPGRYYACLTVTDSNATGVCSATFCDSVIVTFNTPCNAHFAHVINPNNADSVHFILNGPPGTTFVWTFGDGTTYTGPSPWHVYALGNYYACVTVTITGGPGGPCTSGFCDSVIVAPPTCNAHFLHYTIASNPDSLHFYPTNTAATHYFWDFGDGDTSTAHTPWHLYVDGHYNVCLTIVDSGANGICTATLCDSVHIGNTSCNAHFFHYTLNNPDSIHFYPASTSPNHYYWDFGDGDTSTQATPWHEYLPGNYYVCLTVMDSDGTGTCTATYCDSVHAGNHSCDAHFAHYSLNNPDSIHFYPLFTHLMNYYWDFGDGTNSTAQIPWHAYLPGNYYVCLTVNDSDSTGTCTATLCDSIHVSGQTCDAHFAHYTLTNPDSVHFYPTGALMLNYHWDFGDGATSTLEYPWHLYSGPGNYYACLVVDDSSSLGTCTASQCDSVTVDNISTQVSTIAASPMYFKLFPDPVNEHVIISASGLRNVSELSIYNLSGQIVYDKKDFTEGNYEINTVKFEQGFYFCIISNKNQLLFRQKFIVIH